jgi:hypothetical protein
VKLNRFISEHLSLILKAGQNKIIGSFNKKNKNFINEFSIINSFLTKKKFGIFFSNNSSDSTLLKVFQFQKSSNAILGIPIEKFSLNHYKYFFGGRKDKRIFIMKNIEIFSTLNHFENLKNNQIILIIDINTIISGLEVESSLELILELFFFKKNLRKISSIVLSLSKILNMLDLIKILGLKNLFKFCDSKISNLKNLLFFKPPGINLSLLECKKIKWKNAKLIQNIKLKKSFLIQKEVFFCLNLKSSLKKVKEFVINSGIFFYFDHNKISNENYVNFYISNNIILSKSQKFFISMGLGIHDFNLKIKKRKFIEELDLIGFYQKYWVSISSISKIAMERFFHLKGVLNGLFFIRNQIKFSSFIFNVLSIHCDKIIFCNNKYLSRNILKNSFDFPLESSWKNLFLEKGNIILNNGNFDYTLKKVINQKLGFFFNRLLNNPIFYLSTIKSKKKAKKKKLIVTLLLKLKKYKIIFINQKKIILKTLKGTIMKKYIHREITTRFLLNLCFEKNNNFNKKKVKLVNLSKLNHKNLFISNLLFIKKGAYKKKSYFRHHLFFKKFQIFFSLVKKKELVYYFITLAEIFNFLGNLSFILIFVEKIRNNVFKNYKIKTNNLKEIKNQNLTFFLLSKIHKISNINFFNDFLVLSSKKYQVLLKMSPLIKEFKTFKINIKWIASFSVVEKNQKKKLNLILDRIFLYEFKNDNKTKEIKNKNTISAIWWILIGEKNSDKIIGRFRVNHYKNKKLKITFILHYRLSELKIFILNEKFSFFDSESNFKFL